jgi:hypothetical protein
MMLRNIFFGLFLLRAAEAGTNPAVRRLNPSVDVDAPDICTDPTGTDDCEGYFFHELDATMQECLELWGGDAESWNNANEDVYSFNYWEYAALMETDCAEIWGFDEATWDADMDSEVEADLENADGEDVADFCDDFVGQDKCENHFWHEVSDEIKACLESFGYTETHWDTAVHNDPSMFLYWMNMDADQKECATSFGYDQDSWDNALDDE